MEYTLPILYQTDAVVIGGGIGGMACALKMRLQGKKVLLMERGTCLYAQYHKYGEYEAPILGDRQWAELLFPLSVYAGNGMLHPARLKRHGEALMREQGVELLYAVSLIAAEKDRTGEIKLVLAHKSGLYTVLCREYFDCTKLFSEQTAQKARYSLHLVHGPELMPEHMPLPREIKEGGAAVPAGAMLTLSPGSAGNGHCVLHFPVDWMNEDQLSPEGRLSLHRLAFSVLSAYRVLAHLPQLTPARSGLFCAPRDGIPVEDAIREGIRKAETPDLPGEYQSLREQLSFCNPLFRKVPAAAVTLPEAAGVWEGDVLVVGGGTSGAAAALYAARLGMRTLLIEMNGVLGGTATAGGVSTYWFGLRGGAAREIDQRVSQYYQQLSLKRSPCLWSDDDRFLPDIKALALLDLCNKAGVTIQFESITCAAAMNGNTVRGVAFAKDGRLHLGFARTVIDCTGDGDIAMFAGAAHTYGSREDAMTYWASLAQYTAPDRYRNNFSTMVHVGDPWDYTRFILAGRLRGGDMLDHGEYVALRESRHIQGMEEVTLRDLLSMRRYEDTLYYCFSNYDPKGKLSADIVYFGLLPPNLLISIPRGAVIPVTEDRLPIAGLLVGGKAISCTHNALPSIRMQPDLAQQGLALAALAAASIRQGKPAWQAEGVIDVIRKAGGEIPEIPMEASQDLQAFVDALTGKETLEWLDASPASYLIHQEPVIACFLSEGSRILPVLERAYENEPAGTKRRLLLARLLLWHGSEEGVSEIFDAINALLNCEEGLPRRMGSITFGQLLPDHGLMPEAVYLLNSLSRAMNTEIIPMFETVLHRILTFPRDFNELRQGVYCYIESFAYISVRRGDKRFLPLLRELCDLPEFKSPADGMEQDDLLCERFAMLRLQILHAIALLGGGDGYQGLMAFASDTRRPISLSAQMILARLREGKNQPQPGQMLF